MSTGSNIILTAGTLTHPLPTHHIYDLADDAYAMSFDFAKVLTVRLGIRPYDCTHDQEYSCYALHIILAPNQEFLPLFAYRNPGPIIKRRT